ncbi:MAG: tRNA-intron lyase [Candidatus Altiarchaeales archaeon]|nr:tRNA-intron lyase [Candidatus Altiarchaeales archaeon]
MGYAILSDTKVLVGDSDTKSLCRERGFGEEVDGRQVLSFIEAAYLTELGKLNVMVGEAKLSFDDLMNKGSDIERDFLSKYLVYRDLRNRGMLVRSGLKFGSDFRLYERGERLGRDHSKTLVHVVPEEYTCSFPELARSVRLAGNVNKDMIYALIDEESSITYYKIDRVRL